MLLCLRLYCTFNRENMKKFQTLRLIGVYVYFFSIVKFFVHSVQPFVEPKFQHLLTNLKEFFCNFLKFLLAFPLKYLNRLNVSYILIYFSLFRGFHLIFSKPIFQTVRLIGTVRLNVSLLYFEIVVYV